MLYRSIRLPKNAPIDNLYKAIIDSPDSMVGKKIPRLAFTSVSLAAGQTYQMVSDAPWDLHPKEIPIFFKILVKKRTPGIYLDPPFFDGNGKWRGLREYEILLPRDGALLIKKIYKDENNRVIVEAEFVYQNATVKNQ
ncbi:MAG: hypothetical protein J0M15_11735 [Deltaproteobacteria bacterium]|nr:hypothetical protein [Deltaproteobacteria bacterium]